MNITNKYNWLGQKSSLELFLTEPYPFLILTDSFGRVVATTITKDIKGNGEVRIKGADFEKKDNAIIILNRPVPGQLKSFDILEKNIKLNNGAALTLKEATSLIYN